MSGDAKKTSRMLLRMTEEMEQNVKSLAQLHQRPYQDEIRYLISEGLEMHRPGARKEISVERRQLLSTDGNLRKPKEKTA